MKRVHGEFRLTIRISRKEKLRLDTVIAATPWANCSHIMRKALMDYCDYRESIMEVTSPSVDNNDAKPIRSARRKKKPA